jgi:hypothetical protein
MIPKMLAKFKNKIVHFLKLVRQMLLMCQKDHVFGSKGWLVHTEKRFGGFVKNVPVNTISEADDRNLVNVQKEGMQGGDRMAYHAYAKIYAQYLKPFIKKHDGDLVIIEIGILRGTGLALWCELFPNARVIGLDIDLSNYNQNLNNLISLGAFRKRRPEVYKFDQLKSLTGELEAILRGDKIDICIDDGLHTTAAVQNTMEVVLRHMSDRSVYFVEDYRDKMKVVEKKGVIFGFKVYHNNAITVLSR